MKHLPYLISVIALSMGLHANETALKPVHGARILKIEAALKNTPDYQTKGEVTKEFEPRQWLEIEAEVEVKTSDPSGYIPALEATWYAIVPDKVNKSKNGGVEKPVQLMGASSYKDIRVKDGKVYLSAYIEPRALERYLGDRHISERDFKAFALTLTGEDLYIDKESGMGPYKATAEEAKKWWADWKLEYSDGQILPKSKTPFALIAIDRYPPEKE